MPKRYTFDTQQSVPFFALEISGALKVLESLSTLCGGHGGNREGIRTSVTIYFGQSDIKDIIIPFTIEKLLKYHIMRHSNQNYFEIIGDGHNIMEYYRELKELKPDLKIKIEEKYSQDLGKAIERVFGKEKRTIPCHCQNIEELIEHFQNMFKEKRYKHFSTYDTGIGLPNHNQPEGFTNPVEHTCLQLLAKTLYDLSDLEIWRTIYLLQSKI